MNNRDSESESDSDSIPFGFDLHSFTKSVKTPNATEEAPSIASDLKYENLLNKAIYKLQELRDFNDDLRVQLFLDVRRDAPTKTSVNLREIAASLKREEDHLLRYVMNELLTTGSTNQEGRLYMKGRYSKTQIQEIIKEYIELFVLCKTCLKFDDTEIQKENKMTFLKCNNCGASRHVGSIVEGYKSSGRTRSKL